MLIALPQIHRSIPGRLLIYAGIACVFLASPFAAIAQIRDLTPQIELPGSGEIEAPTLEEVPESPWIDNEAEEDARPVLENTPNVGDDDAPGNPENTDGRDNQNENENVLDTRDTGDEEEFPIPEISGDVDALPFPVRRMRELILEATRTGDIEKLRSLIGIGESMTLLSLGGVDGDPIEHLKGQSGDPEGHELLAILEEILEADYAHIDPGTEHELYVWPYFFSYPLDKLTPPQRVELFRIMTFGDYQDMEDFGGYIFYRVGITPAGRWQFFVAGD